VDLGDLLISHVAHRAQSSIEHLAVAFGGCVFDYKRIVVAGCDRFGCQGRPLRPGVGSFPQNDAFGKIREPAGVEGVFRHARVKRPLGRQAGEMQQVRPKFRSALRSPRAGATTGAARGVPCPAGRSSFDA
jgi:hypothetical protein